MKSLFVVLAVLFATSALAQKHMVEFNADTALIGRMSFNNSKHRDESSTEDKFGYLIGNYAYTVAPQIQFGFQASYTKFRSSFGTSEAIGALVGPTYNFSSDLANSLYLSLYAGWEWEHSYIKDFDNSHDENFITRVALGKRFPLTMLKLDTVTYSLELSFTNTNGTKARSDTEWETDFSIKFLQFSVLF